MVVWRIEEVNVVIYVLEIFVVYIFDIFVESDGFVDVFVVRWVVGEDRVVDYYIIDVVVLVGFNNFFFEVFFVNCVKVEFEFVNIVS